MTNKTKLTQEILLRLIDASDLNLLDVIGASKREAQHEPSDTVRAVRVRNELRNAMCDLVGQAHSLSSAIMAEIEANDREADDAATFRTDDLTDLASYLTHHGSPEKAKAAEIIGFYAEKSDAYMFANSVTSCRNWFNSQSDWKNRTKAHWLSTREWSHEDMMAIDAEAKKALDEHGPKHEAQLKQHT